MKIVAALRLLMNEDLYFIKTENQSRYADDLQGIQLVDEKVPVKTVLFTDYLGNNEKNIMIIVSSDLLPAASGRFRKFSCAETINFK